MGFWDDVPVIGKVFAVVGAATVAVTNWDKIKDLTGFENETSIKDAVDDVENALLGMEGKIDTSKYSTGLFCQQALNSLNHPTGVDGGFGDKTTIAMNNYLKEKSTMENDGSLGGGITNVWGDLTSAIALDKVTGSTATYQDLHMDDKRDMTGPDLQALINGLRNPSSLDDSKSLIDGDMNKLAQLGKVLQDSVPDNGDMENTELLSLGTKLSKLADVQPAPEAAPAAEAQLAAPSVN